MRRRLVLSTIAAVTTMLIVLMVPISFILRDAANSALRARTEQQATALSARLEAQFAAGEPSERSVDLSAADGILTMGDAVRVFGPDGNVIAARDLDKIVDPFRATVAGPNGTRVQVITNSTAADERFRRQLAQLGVIAATAVGVAALVAFAQARQLARPLEHLARTAARVGDGDFSAGSGQSSGIDEIDGIAQALRLSNNRVARMLDSERGFTADATHQLRTGLTGLAMRLELLQRNDDPLVAAEATATLTQVHDLNATLDELLAVARRGTSGERTEIDLAAIVDHHVSDWEPQFSRRRRNMVITVSNPATVVGTPGLVGQILNVLLENSLVHGGGTVAILIQDTSVTIEDDGDGIPMDRTHHIFERPADHQAAHGRGLPLARRLAEADGGRLELVRSKPAAFRLTLLAANGSPMAT